MLLFVCLIPTGLFSQINVITYNIRYNNPDDGPNSWPHRRADVVNLLKFHQADIFCLQEALHDQVRDVEAAFPGFGWVGVGRDDGSDEGEFAPVFNDRNRFDLMESDHFWLSETPGQPSFGWDAACRRICTWVRLKLRSDASELYVFNTHFDHRGTEARDRSAELILNRIEEIAGDLPVILTGDLNLSPGSAPIRRIAAVLDDSFRITELPPHGSVATWSGFSYSDQRGDRIDYIFISKGTRVLRYAGLTDARDDRFFSDHLPVMATIEF
jgi:endonuclease/exonuclease/phosphatase family metal-dependent hydrolase